MNIRTMVRLHLWRERLDVLLAVLVPLVIMLESGYANAWVFAGGHFGFDLNSGMAVLRGVFLEALIFACFKLVKVFVMKKLWYVTLLPALLGGVGMIASAGFNLGWVNQSPEMHGVLSAVALYMPGWIAGVFPVGLGLLFPIGVGVFALFDVSHLVEEALSSSDLDNRAVMISRSELHRTAYLKEQKQSIKRATEDYKDICEADTHSMVEKVRKGDLSFGAAEITPALPPRPAVKRIAAPVQVSTLPAASYPTMPMQPPIQGQVGPAPSMPTGNTRNIVIPPQYPPPGFGR